MTEKWKLINTAKDVPVILGGMQLHTAKSGELIGGGTMKLRAVKCKFAITMWVDDSGNVHYPTHWREWVELPVK